MVIGDVVGMVRVGWWGCLFFPPLTHHPPVSSPSTRHYQPGVPVHYDSLSHSFYLSSYSNPSLLHPILTVPRHFFHLILS